MTIGIFYETDNWCNHQLFFNLQNMKINTYMLQLDKGMFHYNQFESLSLIVNRIFPSAHLRGYNNTNLAGGNLLKAAFDQGIQIVNPYETFIYDQSKFALWNFLKKDSFRIPELIYMTNNHEGIEVEKDQYPVILKPDQGGCSEGVHIVKNSDELKSIIKKLPNVPYMVQEYIEPDKDYTIRVEVVDNKIMAVFKRSISSSGISSHHRGSIYEIYNNYPPIIETIALSICYLLKIGMGGIDFVERGNKFYVIDVNSTSNFSEDKVNLLGFDPTLKMAEYIKKCYEK